MKFPTCLNFIILNFRNATQTTTSISTQSVICVDDALPLFKISGSTLKSATDVVIFLSVETDYFKYTTTAFGYTIRISDLGHIVYILMMSLQRTGNNFNNHSTLFFLSHTMMTSWRGKTFSALPLLLVRRSCWTDSRVIGDLRRNGGHVMSL